MDDGRRRDRRRRGRGALEAPSLVAAVSAPTVRAWCAAACTGPADDSIRDPLRLVLERIVHSPYA